MFASVSPLQCEFHVEEEHLTWHARTAQLLGDIYGQGVVVSIGFVLRMYLFETAKGPNGPRAFSKITKWVPIVFCS